MYWLETVHIMKQLNMSHTNILHNVKLFTCCNAVMFMVLVG
jgi:hypothetical protein